MPPCDRNMPRRMCSALAALASSHPPGSWLVAGLIGCCASGLVQAVPLMHDNHLPHTQCQGGPEARACMCMQCARQGINAGSPHLETQPCHPRSRLPQACAHLVKGVDGCRPVCRQGAAGPRVVGRRRARPVRQPAQSRPPMGAMSRRRNPAADAVAPGRAGTGTRDRPTRSPPANTGHPQPFSPAGWCVAPEMPLMVEEPTTLSSALLRLSSAAMSSAR